MCVVLSSEWAEIFDSKIREVLVFFEMVQFVGNAAKPTRKSFTISWTLFANYTRN